MPRDWFWVERRLRVAFGFILELAAILQESSGLTTRCHDSFPEAEYQQLSLRVVFMGRRFHLMQVVNGNHLACAFRAGVWHAGRVSRNTTSEKVTEDADGVLHFWSNWGSAQAESWALLERSQMYFSASI